jgi:hypothetical protein
MSLMIVKTGLGFYAYEISKPVSIDSFAIYSYSVPLEVAKRRFVWGQGVDCPRNNKLFS